MRDLMSTSFSFRPMSSLAAYAALLLCLLLVLPSQAWAASPVNTLKRGLIRDSDTGVAINGYDPVAYFTEHKPVPGKPTLRYSWNGANGSSPRSNIWIYSRPRPSSTRLSSAATAPMVSRKAIWSASSPSSSRSSTASCI